MYNYRDLLWKHNFSSNKFILQFKRIIRVFVKKIVIIFYKVQPSFRKICNFIVFIKMENFLHYLNRQYRNGCGKIILFTKLKHTNPC